MNELVDKFNTAYDRHSRRGGRTAFMWKLLCSYLAVLLTYVSFFVGIAHRSYIGRNLGSEQVRKDKEFLRFLSLGFAYYTKLF